MEKNRKSMDREEFQRSQKILNMIEPEEIHEDNSRGNMVLLRRIKFPGLRESRQETLKSSMTNPSSVMLKRSSLDKVSFKG